MARAAQFLNIATGPTGGTYYPVGAAMAKIWSDNIKDLRASAQSAGGTFNNIALLGKGEAEACFADGLYYDAYFGKGRYDGDPQKFLRGVVVLYKLCEINGREARGSPLKWRNGSYEIDYEELEAALSLADTRLFLLCNPHNPTGRVFSRDELARIGEICLAHDVIVFSDEIHEDIV